MATSIHSSSCAGTALTVLATEISRRRRNDTRLTVELPEFDAIGESEEGLMEAAFYGGSQCDFVLAGFFSFET